MAASNPPHEFNERRDDDDAYNIAQIERYLASSSQQYAPTPQSVQNQQVALNNQGQQDQQMVPYNHFQELEASNQPQQSFPSGPSLMQPPGPPQRQPFEGPLNFKVKISCKWYSEILRKFYVKDNEPFAVEFSWDKTNYNLYVRACLVFSKAEHADKRISCCPNHKDLSNIQDHMLRSEREPGSASIWYCGDINNPDSWLSVVAEFTTRGSATKEGVSKNSHSYKMVCQNTCAAKRRAVDVVFTLFDYSGEVLGVQVFGAKCCGKPDRDIKKDEKKLAMPGGSRSSSAARCDAVRHSPRPGPSRAQSPDQRHQEAPTRARDRSRSRLSKRRSATPMSSSSNDSETTDQLGLSQPILDALKKMPPCMIGASMFATAGIWDHVAQNMRTRAERKREERNAAALRRALRDTYRRP